MKTIRIAALVALLVLAGCASTMLVDHRQCKEVGPDHLSCPGKAIREIE
jgi:hypothetical protein